MSKGKEQHQQRIEELNKLGKGLARRSHSQCELCGAHGVKLMAYEVEPAPENPDLEHTLFACETCKTQLDNPKRMDPDHWHCLSTSVWSEIPCVQVQAVKTLMGLKAQDWANDLMEQLYLPPETLRWLEDIGIDDFSVQED